MKQLKIFYLEGCPYCRRAREAVRELTAERPAYAKAEIEWIEETLQPAVADRYDYWYVPSVFLGERKLFEAAPTDTFQSLKKAMQSALDAAIS